ncbi:protein prenyltransferase alpha subunit repeat-containing protein 1-like isoform X2 [Panicum virgatum]|uniref:protein prenyltransferase alpha subunit repeat-containing protein 1-like isoform X2 n=1 Tax=Panicum virgatum TaxID=38727 RepID=UPI0019D55E22|nr:protein prenyltransferase alpha subunit repeat-containing protein 1-like isoform X2 [Panicum virgatum]
MEQEDGSAAAAAEQQAGGAEEQLAEDLLHHFERVLHSDPLIDEVGFLHPTQFNSLGCGQDGDSAPQAPELQHRYFWCRDHKLGISAEILPKLYRAARDAYYNSRNAPLPATLLMSHTKALLILCPDLLTAWNSRKMVLSEKYDFTKLKDELQLCALILSYSPKNESTWSHRRWVLKQVAEQHQDMTELVEKESVLVKEIAERSKMNYRAWRHRCWLIPYMTRKQVLDELKKSTRWSELHVADNCCFHYRRSLLLALLDSHLENREDSLSWESETYLLWKEELRWNEMLIRRYQGRESLWNHRRFLSQWWIQQLLAVEKNCPSMTSQVDLFITQEIDLLSECLNDPVDDFEEPRIQAELSGLYILWISKQFPAVNGKLKERLHSVSIMGLKDVLVRACRLEKTRLWMNVLGLADPSQ